MKRTWSISVTVAILATMCMSGCSISRLSLPSFKPMVATHDAFDRELSMARLSERQGNDDAAAKIYNDVIAKNPNNQLAQHRLGVMAAKQGHHELAMKHFETAYRSGPPSSQLLADIGYVHYLKKDYDQSEAKLREAVSLDPNNKFAQNNLGLVMGEQGKYDASLAAFRAASSEAEAISNLAFVQSQVGALKEAEKNYHHALELDQTLRSAAEALMQVASRTAHESILNEQLVEKRAKPLPEAARMTAEVKPEVPKAVVVVEQSAEKPQQTEINRSPAEVKPEVPKTVALNEQSVEKPRQPEVPRTVVWHKQQVENRQQPEVKPELPKVEQAEQLVEKTQQPVEVKPEMPKAELAYQLVEETKQLHAELARMNKEAVARLDSETKRLDALVKATAVELTKGVDQKLSSAVNELDSRLTGKFSAEQKAVNALVEAKAVELTKGVDQKLSSAVNELDSRLTGKFSAEQQALNALNNKLATQVKEEISETATLSSKSLKAELQTELVSVVESSDSQKTPHARPIQSTVEPSMPAVAGIAEPVHAKTSFQMPVQFAPNVNELEFASTESPNKETEPSKEPSRIQKLDWRAARIPHQSGSSGLLERMMPIQKTVEQNTVEAHAPEVTSIEHDESQTSIPVPAQLASQADADGSASTESPNKASARIQKLDWHAARIPHQAESSGLLERMMR